MSNKFRVIGLLSASLMVGSVAAEQTPTNGPSPESVNGSDLKRILLKNKSTEEFQQSKADLMTQKIKISDGMVHALEEVTSASLGDIGKGSDSFKSFGDALENDSAMEEFDSAKRLNSAISSYLVSEEELITKQVKYLQAKKGLDKEYQSSETLQKIVRDQAQKIASLEAEAKQWNQKIANIEIAMANFSSEKANATSERPKDFDTAFVSKADDILGYNGRSNPSAALDFENVNFSVLSVKIVKIKTRILKKQATISYSYNPDNPEIITTGDVIDGWRVDSISDDGIDVSKLNPSTQVRKTVSLKVLKY